MCLVLNKAEEHTALIHISDRLSFISELSLTLHKLRIYRKQIHRNILVTMYCSTVPFVCSFHLSLSVNIKESHSKCRERLEVGPLQDNVLEKKEITEVQAAHCEMRAAPEVEENALAMTVQTHGITRTKDLGQADG